MKIISPYLRIYRVQVSSIFSIFERLSGVLLTGLCFMLLFIFKMKVVLINSYFFYVIIFYIFKNDFDSIIFLSILLFILMSCAYHISFGIRYIIWDSYGMEDLNLSKLKKSVNIYLFIGCLLFIIMFILML